MINVFLGLGSNVDRERSMRAGLEALKLLDSNIIVSQMYESDAVGFEGAPFYNCVAQLHTELSLADLIKALKIIESANGRDRTILITDGKGLDIDVLTYGDLVGCFDHIELPRSDITCYAHVLLPLSEIAPDVCLPGSQQNYQHLWQNFDKNGQSLEVVDFNIAPSSCRI